MTDLPLPFVVNMREYEKCSTVLEKFDWMLSTQGSLRFAGHRFDEAKGEAYGVALMMFMEDYGVQLRTALALHESAKTNAEVPLPEPRISVSSYTSNGPEQMEFVTVDQLHAYAAAKTAELQAECARLREKLAAASNANSELCGACTRQVKNIEAWLETGEPAGPDESKSIYEQLCKAIDRCPMDIDAALRGKE